MIAPEQSPDRNEYRNVSQSLLDHLPRLADRVTAATHRLLGLDYDGTLTPLVDDPSKAMLSHEARELLGALGRRPGTSIAIVSGRALDDVRNRVGIAELTYAGNHGLEISGPGYDFIEPTSNANRRLLGLLAAKLTNGLAHIAGAVVENKELSLSVHFRRVAATQVNEVRQHVEAAVALAPGCFRMSQGNKVFEVRPQVDWNKGEAVRWIRNRLAVPNSLTMYLGDDLTDEDAFVALRDGLTVKVGDSSETAARYHLANAVEVTEFLRWLAHTIA